MFVEYKSPPGQPSSWNVMTFYKVKVLAMDIKEYSTGKRLDITVEPLDYHHKYYLFCWIESGSEGEAIVNSPLKIGDVISIHAVLQYYRGKNGNIREGYRIIANPAYDKSIPESEVAFNLLYIKDEDEAVNFNTTSSLSKEDLMKALCLI